MIEPFLELGVVLHDVRLTGEETESEQTGSKSIWDFKLGAGLQYSFRGHWALKLGFGYYNIIPMNQFYLRLNTAFNPLTHPQSR